MVLKPMPMPPRPPVTAPDQQQQQQLQRQMQQTQSQPQHRMQTDTCHTAPSRPGAAGGAGLTDSNSRLPAPSHPASTSNGVPTPGSSAQQGRQHGPHTQQVPNGGYHQHQYQQQQQQQQQHGPTAAASATDTAAPGSYFAYLADMRRRHGRSDDALPSGILGAADAVDDNDDDDDDEQDEAFLAETRFAAAGIDGGPFRGVGTLRMRGI